MNLVPAWAAAAAGVFILLVPGLVFLALLRPRDRDALAWDESVFLALAVSVTLSAWLGLALAEAGGFSLLRAAGLLAAASLAVLWLLRRRLAAPLRLPRRAGEIAPALAVLALALALDARPTEYVVGGRDPGTYVAAMALIGRTGGIVYTDPAVLALPPDAVELFYRHAENRDFSWGRFMGFPLERPETGRVFPEFFHLFPAFGAYLFQAMGVKGALATPPLFGILGTLGAYLFFRRLLGTAPALLGALLLATNEVQVWFARYPVSEPMSQFLLFLGLLAFAHWEERGGAAFAALAGFALGVSLLVRIDSVLLVIPLGAYLLIRRARHELRWREALPLLVPFGVMTAHAAVHAALFSRKYLLNIAQRPYWSQPAAVWLGLAAATGLALLGAHLLGPRLSHALERRPRALRAAVMSVIALLAVYGYALRPWLSAWAGADGNDPARVTDSQTLLGLLRELGFQRLAAHDAQAFLRLGWFVTPPGLLLGVLGLLLLLRDWPRRALFPTLTLLGFALFYFYKLRVWNDYFFALRRFVPVVLPFTLFLAAFALARLAARPGWRRALAGLAAAGLLAAFGARSWPLLRYTDWGGSVRFSAELARRFSPQDVVIFEQAQSIHLISLPLWAVHGVNALELARFNPQPDRLNDLIRRWRSRYRNIYFVYTYRTDLCGVFLQKVEDHLFLTREWERSYDRPPRGPEARSLRFSVARVVLPEELQVPALPELDVGASDDFQVSGFYDKERDGDATFRWTGRCGSVYLPGAEAGAALELTVASQRRPASALPAVVAVRFAGRELGRLPVEREWRTHAFELPQPLPGGPPILRLDVVHPVSGRPATFRPENVVAGSRDVRDLGVMLDRIRIRGARAAAAKIPRSAAAAGRGTQP